MKFFRLGILSVFLLLPLVGSAQLTTFLSNLPGNLGGHGNVASNNQRAVTFNVLSTPLTLTSASFLLYDYTSPSDEALVSIHLSNGTTPGTQVGDTLIAPASASDATATFTFTSPGITLNANTTYWLIIAAGNTTDTFKWWRSEAVITPATTEFASFGDQWINDGSGWDDGESGAHSFSIAGTPIPEAEDAVLVFAAGLLALITMRWRSRGSNPSLRS